MREDFEKWIIEYFEGGVDLYKLGVLKGGDYRSHQTHNMWRAFKAGRGNKQYGKSPLQTFGGRGMIGSKSWRELMADMERLESRAEEQYDNRILFGTGEPVDLGVLHVREDSMTVEFKYQVGQVVITVLGEPGLVGMAAIDDGGIQYHVVTQQNSAWYKEDQLNPKP